MSTHQGDDTTSRKTRIKPYLDAGYTLTPVEARGKNPLRTGWQRERLTLPELEAIIEADPDLNIGMLNGEPSGNLVDVDHDCQETLAVSDDFLPTTAAVFGRASKPRSHKLYRASLKTEQFKDPIRAKSRDDAESAMLVEIRSTGTQTVGPGSTHGSGEAIEWAERDEWDDQGVPEAAEVDPAALRRGVALTATTALLGRYYPRKGVRHEFELALAGGLLNADVPPDEVTKVINGIAKAHGIEVDGSAPATVASTVAKIAEGQAVTGWPKVEECLGEHGEAIVKAVRKWLGLKQAKGPTQATILTDLGKRCKLRDRSGPGKWKSRCKSGPPCRHHQRTPSRDGGKGCCGRWSAARFTSWPSAARASDRSPRNWGGVGRRSPAC